MESFRSDEGFGTQRVRLQDLYCIPHAGTFADSKKKKQHCCTAGLCSYATTLPPDFRIKELFLSTAAEKEALYLALVAETQIVLLIEMCVRSGRGTDVPFTGKGS